MPCRLGDLTAGAGRAHGHRMVGRRRRPGVRRLLRTRAGHRRYAERVPTAGRGEDRRGARRERHDRAGKRRRGCRRRVRAAHREPASHGRRSTGRGTRSHEVRPEHQLEAILAEGDGSRWRCRRAGHPPTSCELPRRRGRRPGADWTSDDAEALAGARRSTSTSVVTADRAVDLGGARRASTRTPALHPEPVAVGPRACSLREALRLGDGSAAPSSLLLGRSARRTRSCSSTLGGVRRHARGCAGRRREHRAGGDRRAPARRGRVASRPRRARPHHPTAGRSASRTCCERCSTTRSVDQLADRPRASGTAVRRRPTPDADGVDDHGVEVPCGARPRRSCGPGRGCSDRRSTSAIWRRPPALARGAAT